MTNLNFDNLFRLDREGGPISIIVTLNGLESAETVLFKQTGPDQIDLLGITESGRLYYRSAGVLKNGFVAPEASWTFVSTLYHKESAIKKLIEKEGYSDVTPVRTAHSACS